MKLWRVNPLYYVLMGLIFLSTNLVSVFAQNKTKLEPSQKELDSIYRLYTLSNNDSLSISDRIYNLSEFLKGVRYYNQDSLIYKGLMQKTWLFGKIKRYDSAIVYSHQLYDLANSNRDTAYISRALLKLGIYHKKNNQLTKAFEYYNENFKISREVKDTLRAGRSLLNMANIQTFLGDHSGSKTTAIDGLKYIENTTDLRSLSGLYHIISVANRHQNNFEEALKYNKQALALDKDSISKNSIGIKHILIFKNTKALILANQENYQKAIDILETLVSDSIVKRDSSEYARVLGNLGYLYWLENKENKNSERVLINALEIRKKIKDIEGLITSNIYLTKYYLEKDKTKALYFAEAAYENAKKRHNLRLTIEALGFIFDLKENTNEEAKIYNAVYNELTEINQSNREIYAVTKYDNDKLTTQNLVLKAETAKQRTQKIIYLAGTVILLLVGGFLFYLLQQRLKREKIREVYNAETRISKKIHDELANDVYNIMIQLQNNNDDPRLLDKVEDVYLRTRDISRENSSLEIGVNYAQELSSMLSSYSTDNTMIIIKGVNEIGWQPITPEKKIIIHRVLQEIMVNMKKHSNAQLVAVTFKKTPKYIEINYSDNGVGASIEAINYSNGLSNVENRIKTIGGIFIFDSEIGKGFKAKISFPS